MDVPHNILIEKFGESLGLDKSEQIIETALMKSGLKKSPVYLHDDVLQLLFQIRDENSGYIKIISKV